VQTEQEMMEPLRQRADVVIDTTHLSTAQLRGELLRHFGSDTTEKGGMSVTITSFGFKYGLPMEADLVADGELLLHYDKSDVIETDRTRYLLGAAEVSEIDQNGNECSINLFTLERTIDYVNENLTVVSIGGELVPALRLI
jgi:RNase adaptor protein for sRNA GlmZ degradation